MGEGKAASISPSSLTPQNQDFQASISLAKWTFMGAEGGYGSQALSLSFMTALLYPSQNPALLEDQPAL